VTLRDVLRFHHRRGLRERYLPQFDSLMIQLCSDIEEMAMNAKINL